MLIADAFLYSRSKSVDYRWIYINEFVHENSTVLNAEYHKFEQNRNDYLEKNPLYVRWTPDSITIYRFLETQNIDNFGRQITALVGYTFTQPYYYFVHHLFIPVITYFHFHPELFYPIFEDVSDELNNIQIHIEVGLDSIVEEAVQSSDFLKFTTFFQKKAEPHLKKNKPFNFVLTSSKFKVIVDSSPDITGKSSRPFLKFKRKKHSPKQNNDYRTNRCNQGYDYLPHYKEETNGPQIY